MGTLPNYCLRHGISSLIEIVNLTWGSCSYDFLYCISSTCSCCSSTYSCCHSTTSSLNIWWLASIKRTSKGILIVLITFCIWWEHLIRLSNWILGFFISRGFILIPNSTFEFFYISISIHKFCTNISNNILRPFIAEIVENHYFSHCELHSQILIVKTKLETHIV